LIFDLENFCKRIKVRSEKRLAPENYFKATIIVYTTVPITGFATDIYLPSMPQMASELQTSQSSIQLTLSLFLIGFGLTQIIAGTFLDTLGRYKISLLALFIFSLSCISTATTGSLMVIYIMRVVQGVCMGFLIVALRVFFVDIYEGEKKKSYLSLMTIVWSVGPIAAPFVGGYLESIFGWRSNFYALSVYGVLLIVALLIFSGETLKIRMPMNFSSVFKSYATILSARDFISGIMILGISYAMIMLFSLTGAFIIEHKMGFSAIVAGYVALFLGFAWMCGGFISKGLVSKRFLVKIKVAYIVQTVLIIVMMASAYLVSNIWTLILFAFLIHVTAGFIFNNYFTYCLSRFPQFAGVAGGLTGGLAYTFTSILSYGLVAAINPESQLAVGAGYLVIGAIGIGILRLSDKIYLLE